MTDWFPGSVRPVHLGVYQRDENENTCFSYWDGNNWGWNKRTPKDALKFSLWHSNHQCLPWRGLTKDEHEQHMAAT